MNQFNRRDFIQYSSMAAVGTTIGGSGLMAGKEKEPEALKISQSKVNFIYDGLALSPLEYTYHLKKLAEEQKIREDSYSLGGVVEELEQKFAEILGKESAVFMPTGTLANQIAIRELAGGKKRAIVQAESHIYNDCGDCVQNLSNINLIPLKYNEPGFTVEDVKQVLSRTGSGRVASPVGVIVIESPVRRMHNRMFDFEEMKKISELARNEGIKLHMDGARLFNVVAHSGKSLKEYSDLFDTVYVSLYKNFNAAAGAILAGPKSFTEGLYHVRRMFGGGLPAAWPYAAIALQYADTFPEEYQKAVDTVKELSEELNDIKNFKVERFTDGTSIFELHIKDTDLDKFRKNLEHENIFLRSPAKEFSGFYMKINPSVNRSDKKTLVKAFKKSLKA